MKEINIKDEFITIEDPKAHKLIFNFINERFENVKLVNPYTIEVEEIFYPDIITIIKHIKQEIVLQALKKQQEELKD
jgi:hypothetical protein